MLNTIVPLVLNSQGLIQFVLQYIVPLLLTVIGVVIIAGAKKGNYSGVMSTTGIVVIGLIFIVGAGGIVLLAKQLSQLALGG